MPIPSEPCPLAQWAPPSRSPRRSVFGNYRAEAPPNTEPQSSAAHPTSPTPPSQENLQEAIDCAMARAFICRFLAKAYEDPTPEGWRWLWDTATQESLRAACEVATAGVRLSPGAATLKTGETGDMALNPEMEILVRPTTGALSPRSLPATQVRTPFGPRPSDFGLPNLSPGAFDSFHSAYLAAFGHAARGSCPLNEIEYGDIKTDPLFRPHRLADLAAFYRAFGLELADDAGERHDHLCLELEFLCVLAIKEAYALEHQVDHDHVAQCREAQRKFLREHLGRWVPAFARRLAAAATDPILRALAEFTRAFVASESHRFGVNPGSEDLLLRPADEAAESLCASCGLSNLPPGALAGT